MTPPLHPSINALLNGIAAVFLFLGWRAIKRKQPDTHKKWMMAAFASSTLFLISYVLYHYAHPEPTRYEGPGWMRTVYYIILIPHILLAMAMLPFIIAALIKAFRKNYAGHARITRWLWPVWMYVSVTGVLIYLMLYIF